MPSELGLVTRKIKHVFRELEFSAAQPLGKEKGLEMEFKYVANDLFNHAYVMKP